MLLKTVFKREKKEQHRLFKICFLCGRPSADLILPGGRERFLIKNGESEWNVRRNCGREITVVIGQVIVGGEMFGGDILSLVLQLYTIGFVTNVRLSFSSLVLSKTCAFSIHLPISYEIYTFNTLKPYFVQVQESCANLEHSKMLMIMLIIVLKIGKCTSLSVQCF